MDQSPCLSCASTACCTHLEICTVAVEGPAGLDHLGHLLRFDRFELGLSPEGTWAVYAASRCRRLTDDRRCSVWGTPGQPATCRDFDERSCWYVRVFDRQPHAEHLRLDAARFAAVRPLIGACREGLGVPDWPAALSAAAGAAAPVGIARRGDRRAGSGGAEWMVRFRRPPAADAADLDHLRYVAGFDGVEVHVDGDDWWVAVRAGLVGPGPAEPDHALLYEVARAPAAAPVLLDWSSVDAFVADRLGSARPPSAG